MLNKIEVPPLSVYELSVCNTVCELCQLRDNLYSCDMYIDMTDINAMLNVVCNIKQTGNTLETPHNSMLMKALSKGIITFVYGNRISPL